MTPGGAQRTYKARNWTWGSLMQSIYSSPVSHLFRLSMDFCWHDKTKELAGKDHWYIQSMFLIKHTWSLHFSSMIIPGRPGTGSSEGHRVKGILPSRLRSYPQRSHSSIEWGKSKYKHQVITANTVLRKPCRKTESIQRELLCDKEMPSELLTVERTPVKIATVSLEP